MHKNPSLPHLPWCSLHLPQLFSSRLCPSPSSFPASPGYITLPLAVSWFQLQRLRPGTALGGAEELGTQTDSGWRPAGAREISQMGDGVARDPVPPPYTSHLPPPTRDLAEERESTVSLRGVSGLRQKCGLGGQGWRRRGGAERPESLGLEPYWG